MSRAGVRDLVLGILFLTMGCGALGAEWYEHKAWHPPHAGIGVGLALLGALLIDPTSVKTALAFMLDAVKAILPWKSGSPPPAS